MPPFQALRSSHLDRLTLGDVGVLLANARVLRDADPSDATRRAMLRGKKLGLVCAAEDGADALFFTESATELGAHVSHIRSHPSEMRETSTARDTARVLGRLYDAVECQGLDADVVRQVGDDAGVPVYDNIASPSHPTAALADLLGDGSPAQRRRLVLQAILVSTIGAR